MASGSKAVGVPFTSLKTHRARLVISVNAVGRSPRLVPETRMKDFTLPAKTLERIPKGEDGHEQDWIRACKGGRPASSTS